MPENIATPAQSTDEFDRWEGDPKNTETGYRDPAPFEVAAHDHRFTFYPAGIDRLAALIEHIDGAKRSLDVMFYMFQADEAGTTIRDALLSAAGRGVKVHLIVDDFGSDAPKSFFQPLVDAGGQFNLFQSRWNVRYLVRNHQKFVIADEDRVMTGGFNASDHYFKPPEENGWSDLGVVVEGPAVSRFNEWFSMLKDWTEDDAAQFRAIRKLIREWEPGNGPVQLLLGGPTRTISTWAQRLRRDLGQGQRLDLVMAYFSPSRKIRKFIQRLAARGNARLIMAGKTDNGVTIGASRSFYGRLLQSGAHIAEFQPCKLHMKLLVIDDITYFGSANMDMRSVRLNLELMLRIEDAALADKMREMIDQMEAHSTPITEEWYAKRATWFNRLRWRIAHILVSVIDYTVTRRLNLGL